MPPRLSKTDLIKRCKKMHKSPYVERGPRRGKMHTRDGLLNKCGPSRSRRSPSRSRRSPSRSMQSAYQIMRSPYRAMRSPYRAMRSPYRSVQSPSQRMMYPAVISRKYDICRKNLREANSRLKEMGKEPVSTRSISIKKLFQKSPSRSSTKSLKKEKKTKIKDLSKSIDKSLRLLGKTI